MVDLGQSFPYISLKEASQISGYHPDYLGYLVRENKIEGKKIGRNWFTTEKAVRNYVLDHQFLPFADILSFKLKGKKSTLILGGVAILIGIGAFFAFHPASFFQKAPGDFGKNELQAESRVIGGGPKEKIEVTTYSSDETGEIEISVESPKASSPKEKSFWEKIVSFFEKI